MIIKIKAVAYFTCLLLVVLFNTANIERGGKIANKVVPTAVL